MTGPPAPAPLRVAIHQPGYHRHLYYFAKMAAADAFVSLDTVQYLRREWQNRQEFVHAGRRRWLTVPVRGGREPIRNKRLSDPGAARDHWTLIQQLYRRAPHFAEHEAEFGAVYARDWTFLVDLCDALTEVVRRAIGIDTPYLTAGDLLPETDLTRGALLGELAVRAAARAGGADRGVAYVACATPMRPDHYLRSPAREGTGATELDRLAARGVEVRTFRYRHPVYRQAQLPHGAPFEADLAACDLVFNAGPRARDILLAGARPETVPVR